MSSVVISGDTSGTVTLSAPAVAGSNTITMQAATATMSVNTLATAVASTSGTSIDFTSLPSWVKRITVMFNGVSTSGTSNILVQLGSSTVTTTGYISSSTRMGGSTMVSQTYTAGYGIYTAAAADTYQGLLIITTLGSNVWAAQGGVACNTTSYYFSMAGAITLGGVLDRVRVTTVNGTDTFDAGTINILYEG